MTFDELFSGYLSESLISSIEEIMYNYINNYIYLLYITFSKFWFIKNIETNLILWVDKKFGNPNKNVKLRKTSKIYIFYDLILKLFFKYLYK